MRKSFNGLAAIAEDIARDQLKNGALFVFTNKRHNRFKALYYDRTGVCILAKRLDPDQLELLLGEELPKKLQASSSENETSTLKEANVAKTKKTRASQRSRIKGLDQLEVKEHTIEPDLDPTQDYQRIGEEVTELLDYQPGRCFLTRTIRPKYRCLSDRTQPPAVAPAPSSPLQGGLPGFSLVTDLIIGKYADHFASNKSCSAAESTSPETSSAAGLSLHLKASPP